MNVLPLDDPRWAKLGSRAGDGRKVTPWLERLKQFPEDEEALDEIEALIGTESTTCPVAYITVPYLAAAALLATDKKRHALMIGLAATYSGAKSIDECPNECPEDVFIDYREGLICARSMLFELVPGILEFTERKWYLGALVSLLNDPKLGDFLTGMQCPHCGELCMEE